MKKFMIILFALVVVLMPAFLSAEWVSGYYRSNGTYVQGYNRSNSNSTVTDNYSYKGNVNPYTGETGTNYYRNSPTSEYYKPSYTPKKKSSNYFGW